MRRKAQLLAFRSDVKPVDWRGNVATRLRKLDAGDGGVAAIVLAAAGLLRTSRAGRITQFLPVPAFLPAAAQGAIALQTRAGDATTTAIAASLDHPATRRECEVERRLVSLLGAGCNAPVATLAQTDGSNMTLQAGVYSKDGRRVVSGSVTGSAAEWPALASRLYEVLVEEGAKFLLDEVRGVPAEGQA